MNLIHFTLTVPDVAQTQDFLESYLGLSVIMRGRENGPGAVLTDEAGLRIFITSGAEVEHSENFRLSFLGGSKWETDELRQRLQADGFEIVTAQPFLGESFCVRAPGGFLVAIHADTPVEEVLSGAGMPDGG